MPPITVTVPNGGNNWKLGSTQTIKWSYTGSPGSRVKIGLLKGTAVNRVINSSTSIGSGGSGSYSGRYPITMSWGLITRSGSAAPAMLHLLIRAMRTSLSVPRVWGYGEAHINRTASAQVQEEWTEPFSFLIR